MSNLHNALKYASDVQNALEIAAGMSQDEDGVLRLGETLTPGIDIWTQPEWAFLRNERLGAGTMFSAGVAGEQGLIAFGNVAGSNSIVIVERVGVGAAALMSCNIEVVADSIIAGTLSAPAFFGSNRDRRFTVAGRVFARTGTDPGTTFGAKIDQVSAQANPASDLTDMRNVPVILKPGDDLLIVGQTANDNLIASVRWRERRAFVGELPS